MAPARLSRHGTPSTKLEVNGIVTAASFVGSGSGLTNLPSGVSDPLVAEGTFGSSPLLAVSGAGTRLMWYPRKAAFRAGIVDGTQWDDANIGDYSTAMGRDTEASGEFSTAMGEGTIASGGFSTAFGAYAEASGELSTAMGEGTIASGDNSTAMGFQTIASGRASTAMGNNASTNEHVGSFVYGDGSTLHSAALVTATDINQFVVRAAGGTTFYSSSVTDGSAGTSGVSLAPGASAWATVSDRNRKHLFRTENGESVLEKIAGMPIPSWTYKAQGASIRHLGPMSQDFYAAFGLGQDDLTITTSDISGVNMLAIQALEARTRDLDDVRAELTETRQRLAALETALASLKAVTEANRR